MTYLQRITELKMKNDELSSYLLLLLQRSSGEAFFNHADLLSHIISNKRIEKSVLPNGMIRLEVVDAKEST